MSNWAPINSKLTAIDGDNHDCSSSELPTGQAVPTDALSSGYSNAMDTQSSASPTPPVSHPYYGVASPIPRPSAPTPWQLGPPPPNGPQVSNTDNFASASVSAVDPIRQSLRLPGLRPAYRENIPTRQNSGAHTPRNSFPANSRLSTDRVSDAFDLNTRRLVRLLSPQADGLINRLLTEHNTAPVWRSNVSEVSIINEHAWKLMLETAMEEIKVPICRLSTIGRALKDVYTESEITDEEKRSNATIGNIKNILDRIEQTLALFADMPHIELALAGLRLKRVGLGSADPSRTHAQGRESPAYPGPSSTQLRLDPPPPGRGLRRLDCEADEGFVQSRSGPATPSPCPTPSGSLPLY